MKWYCCLNEDGLSGLGEALIVAVTSCLQNTSLEPHIIYDGEQNSLMAFFVSRGVTIHYHSLSFLDRVKAGRKDGYSSKVAQGAYLRLDIPIVDSSDDTVLYTDVDVVFCKDPSALQTDRTFAAAPEYATSVKPPKPVATVFNSGVMLINLQRMRQALPDLVRFADENEFYFHGNAGYYDQGALNHYFKPGSWDALPQEWNWRPFAGLPTEPGIVHFHGTKPYEVRELAVREPADRDVARLLYNLSPGHYLTSFGLYGRFLPVAAQQALLDSCPYARLSYSIDGPSLLRLEGFDYINDVVSFFFKNAKISPSHVYGSSYVKEYSTLMTELLPSSGRLNILEWGSGFTTLMTCLLFRERADGFLIRTIDNDRTYQQAVGKSTLSDDAVSFHVEDVTGPGRSQADPELAYSTRPLEFSETFDWIFIDGRRRVECGYIAALIASRETIVVIHDFRRGRYQPLLGLFEVIKETAQFRAMRVRRDVWASLEQGRKDLRGRSIALTAEDHPGA